MVPSPVAGDQLLTDATSPADDILAASAQRGDVGAFNQLVERHQGTVYNLCLRMIRNPQAAEDATQETFFAAYRAIKGFRGGVFRGWLLRIAANQCFDQLRQKQRRHTEPLPDEPLILDPAPSPDQQALSAEVTAALDTAIGQLSPEHRLCVLLIDVQGLDYQEAADALNANLGTVKSRLSRARAQLRELLPADFRLGSGGASPDLPSLGKRASERGDFPTQ